VKVSWLEQNDLGHPVVFLHREPPPSNLDLGEHVIHAESRLLA
jgi:hypothetical protein